jgi:hypothetical protein
MSKTTGITIDQVAALLRITVPMAAIREREGSLGFVRYNGDRFISTNAAAMMVEDGSWNFEEQAAHASRVLNADANREATIRDAADAKRRVERDRLEAEAIERARVRIEREERNRAAFGDSLMPPKPRVRVETS